jgi:hypothetical protein
MAASMIGQGVFPLPNFLLLCRYCDLSLDQLYRLYISKNVLNWFRQNNGYKTGEYAREWDGKDDNEHLYEIAESLIEDDSFNSETLYKALAVRYKLLTGAQAVFNA